MTGNRLSQTVDDLNSGDAEFAADQIFQYVYDDNDRLLQEGRDLNADSTPDEITLYEYSSGPAAGNDVSVQTAQRTYAQPGGTLLRSKEVRL